MARTQRTDLDWEAFDAERLAAAINQIKDSENLRFFLRTILGYTDLESSTVKSTDPVLNMFHAGRREVGLEIRQMLSEVSPNFYPQLLMEANDEFAQRQT